MSDKKARIGDVYRFIWRGPQPVEGAAPILNLYEPGSSTPHASSPQNLVAIHADAAISSVDADLKRLTATGIAVATSRGASGRYGAAWLISEEGGTFPVHVAKIEDDLVTLSTRLPRMVGGSSALRWATWTVELDVTVTAAVQRGWRWVVEYAATTGADIFASGVKRDEGLLHVVHQPFESGLDSGQLIDWFPQVIPLSRSGTQDFSSQIEFSEEVMISKIRSAIVGKGNEDLLSGPQFRRAHALFTLADIIEHAEPDQARSSRAKAYSLLEERLQNVTWFDEDGDGVVDEGELDRTMRRTAAAGFSSPYLGRPRAFSSERIP